MWILRHTFAIAVLPVTMAILVPIWLCRRYGIRFRVPETVLEWMCVAAAIVLFLIGAALFVTTCSCSQHAAGERSRRGIRRRTLSCAVRIDSSEIR